MIHNKKAVVVVDKHETGEKQFNAILRVDNEELMNHFDVDQGVARDLIC